MRLKVNPSAYINRPEFLLLLLLHRTESYQSDGWHLARGALCVRRTLQEGKEVTTSSTAWNHSTISLFRPSRLWSAPLSMRGMACRTVRTVSKWTLLLGVPAAVNQSRRRQLLLWTSNGIASASNARTAESRSQETPLLSRTICHCAPSARALRNRRGVWVGRRRGRKNCNSRWQLYCFVHSVSDKLTIIVQLSRQPE